MFRSSQFCIENRPGLEDQTLERAMSELSRLDAPALVPGQDTYRKKDLAEWLSDFHLIAFLQTTQLISIVSLHPRHNEATLC